MGIGLYVLGRYLQYKHPHWGTSGLQCLVWGGFISTVVLFHATCSINSLAHTFGSRTFQTNDNSRNHFLLAIITMGEGWHNNHHHQPGSVKQGFRWWQIDLTYYLLWLLACVGMIHSLRGVRVHEHGEA